MLEKLLWKSSFSEMLQDLVLQLNEKNEFFSGISQGFADFQGTAILRSTS